MRQFAIGAAVEADVEGIFFGPNGLECVAPRTGAARLSAGNHRRPYGALDLPDATLPDRTSGSLRRDSLDAMIARAEAVCERYRRAAAKPGLSPPAARRRLCRNMEEMLARLRAERAAAESRT